ncbi:MAG: glycosyltransferase, partial [Gammaproteobacteria bacterium]
MIRPRVVISTFGSLGDLNPYVAIALELRHRGYEPVIATTPLYRDKITSLGLRFHPVRADLPSYDRPEEAMVRGAMDPMTGIRSEVQTPEQTIGLAVRPGGEVQVIRTAEALAVAEGEAPE